MKTKKVCHRHKRPFVCESDSEMTEHMKTAHRPIYMMQLQARKERETLIEKDPFRDYYENYNSD